MNTKQLTYLAYAALGTLIVAVFLYSGVSFSGSDFVAGSNLLQGIDPATVNTISIKSGENEVTLVRQGDGFHALEKNGYPAAVAPINELLIKLLDIKCASIVSTSESSHAELGVNDDNEEASFVTLSGEGDKVLADIIIGSRVSNGLGNYIRRAGEATVYASSAAINVNADPLEYLDATLFELDEATIEAVTVTGGGRTYQILRDANDNVLLQGIPRGKKAVEGDFVDVFEALTDLEFADAVPADAQNYAFDWVYTVELDSGVKYVVRTAKVDEKYLAYFEAVLPDIEGVSVMPDDSEEQLKEKEALLLSLEKANEFNEIHGAWLYEIDEYDAENMRKPFDDLIEDDK